MSDAQELIDSKRASDLVAAFVEMRSLHANEHRKFMAEYRRLTYLSNVAAGFSTGQALEMLRWQS
jgi:hypothetical protein